MRVTETLLGSGRHEYSLADTNEGGKSSVRIISLDTSAKTLRPYRVIKLVVYLSAYQDESLPLPIVLIVTICKFNSDAGSYLCRDKH